MCARDDYPPYPEIEISGPPTPHCSGCASTDTEDICTDDEWQDLLGYSACCNEPVALGGDCRHCDHGACSR